MGILQEPLNDEFHKIDEILCEPVFWFIKQQRPSIFHIDLGPMVLVLFSLLIDLYDPHGFPAPAWSILLNYKMCYQTFLLILCLVYHTSPTTLLCCPSRSIKEVYNLILNIAYFFHEKWVKNLLKTRLIKQNSVLNSFVLFLLLKKIIIMELIRDETT